MTKPIYDNRSQTIGDSAESLFILACEKRGWASPTRSLKKQDIYEHWDVSMSTGTKVDIKAAKRMRRSDGATQSVNVYGEFKGVTGHDGWLYGKADVIAFEREDDFIVVRRDLLAKLCELFVDEKWASRPTLYQSYRRHNRPDERVGLILMDDIIKLRPFILPK